MIPEYSYWRGRKMDKWIYAIVGLFLLWVIFPHVVPQGIEWVTKFILPWIILYWIIRLVKNIENR